MTTDKESPYYRRAMKVLQKEFDIHRSTEISKRLNFEPFDIETGKVIVYYRGLKEEYFLA